jgi:hypothetical protein
MTTLRQRLTYLYPALSAAAAPLSIGAAAAAGPMTDDDLLAGTRRDALETRLSPHRTKITQTPADEANMTTKRASYDKLFGGPVPQRPSTKSLNQMLQEQQEKTAGPFGPNVVKSLMGMLTGGPSARDVAMIGSKFKGLAPDALGEAAELLAMRDPMTSRLVKMFLPLAAQPGGMDKLIGRAGEFARQLSLTQDPLDTLRQFQLEYDSIDPEFADSLLLFIKRLEHADADDNFFEESKKVIKEVVDTANARDAQIAKAFQTASGLVDEGSDQMQRMGAQSDAARGARNMMFGVGALGAAGVVGDTMLDSVVAPGLAERSKMRAQDDMNASKSVFERADFGAVAAKSLAQSLGGGLGEGITGVGGSAIGAGMSVTMSPMYDRIFTQLVNQDPIMSRATPDELKMLRDAYQSMQRAAPTLARDTFAAKNFLREVFSTGNGPDYATISNLARSEEALSRR